MAKKLFGIVLFSFVLICCAFANVSPSGEYDTKNGYFYWKDIVVTAKDSTITSLTAKAFYSYSTGTWINGRTWGVLLAKVGSDIEAKLYDGVSNSKDANSGSDTLGYALNITSAVANQYFSTGVQREMGTYSASEGGSWVDISIPSELLKNCTVDSNYRLYLYTINGSKYSFESCMGQLTKVNIKQMVGFDTENNKVFEYKDKGTVSTLGIIGGKFNVSSVSYDHATYNASKTNSDNWSTVTNGITYEMYFDHYHDWEYSKKGLSLHAYCKNEDCYYNANSVKISLATNLVKMTTVVESAYSSDESTTWSSSNENVATVDEETGLVKALSAGTTNVTGSSRDGNLARVKVTVL